MNNTEKGTGWIKGIAGCLMPGCFAAGSGMKIYIYLFALAAGYDFYKKKKESENLTALISKEILGIYIRYWPVLFIAALMSFALKKPLAEHFVADSIYCFLGLRFTFCAEWSFLPTFVLVLASAPILLKICDRPGGFLITDALWLVLFSVFTYFGFPQIMNTRLFSSLNASLLGKGLYTALELIPPFTVGFLLAKYDVRIKGKNVAWLKKALNYIGEAWLSLWLIASFLCQMFGKTVFALRYGAVFYILLFAVSMVCAKLLEAAEKKLFTLPG